MRNFWYQYIQNPLYAIIHQEHICYYKVILRLSISLTRWMYRHKRSDKPYVYCNTIPNTGEMVYYVH